MTIIWKHLERLWQYYRDEPFIKNNGVIIDISDDPDAASFKSKIKITGDSWCVNTMD